MPETIPMHIDLADGGWLAAAWNPADSTAVGAPVLLVAPPGCEYERCHRVLVAVAARLAESGVPCLRIDLSGCGESSGDLPEAGPARWATDVAEGLAEVLRLARTRKAVLAGLRLSCRAMLEPAVFGHPAVAALALWEPVLSGEAQLNEWLVAERALLAPYGRVPQVDSAGRPRSCLGHTIGLNLASELAAWQPPTQVPARPVVWISGLRPVPAWAQAVDCRPTPFWDRDPAGELIPTAAVAVVVKAIATLARSAHDQA